MGALIRIPAIGRVSMRNWSHITVCLAVAGCLLLAVPVAAQSQFKGGLDTDGDGALSIEEFVMAMGDRDLGRFDTNGDQRISVSEWTHTGGKFQADTAARFNADGDEYMSADELVQIYLWIFGNRDKNKSGTLTPSEAPSFLTEG